MFAKSDTTEGMAYTGAGFPLGGMLGKITESKGNPSVTITGGRIAALRRDDHGQVALFQVDGSLQPGNSGGPIVEEKTGKFIGVAVAKVGSVDTIGFVVPADEVRRALAGRVGSVEGTRSKAPREPPTWRSRPRSSIPRGWSRVSWFTLLRPPARHDQPQQRRLLAAAPQYQGRGARARPQNADRLRTRPGCLERPGGRRPQDPDPDGPS